MNRDPLWAFSWRAVVVIAAATVVYLLLAGCAGPGTPRQHVGTSCTGQPMKVLYREYLSAWPTLDCAILAAERGAHPLNVAMLVAGVSVACAMATPRGSFIVLPLIGADVWREHELEHLTGKRDPVPGLPLQPEC